MAERALRDRVIPARPATTKRIGDRLPQHAGALRRVWHDHGLSIVLVALFAATMAGQAVSGWHTYNAEREQHTEPGVSFVEYLVTGHFG